MRRDFAEALCLDPASVLATDGAAAARRTAVIAGLRRDLRALDDDQLGAIARLVGAIAETRGQNHD